MDVGGLLAGVVAALALLGAGGSAWAFLADRGNKDRLGNLRDDIVDRNVRIDFLEKENERYSRERIALDGTVATLKSEIVSLNRNIDGSAGALAAIRDLVQAHHEAAVAGIALLETQNADLLRIVGDRRHVPPENVTREVQRDE